MVFPLFYLFKPQSPQINLTILSSTLSNSTLKGLIFKCLRYISGTKVKPVSIDVTIDQLSIKRQIIPFGSRKPVYQALMKLVMNGILTILDSSVCTTPIVNPLKGDGKTFRICGD